MKLPYIAIVLCALACGLSTVSAETQANETTKNPGWFERLFGSKEESVVVEEPAEEAEEVKEKEANEPDSKEIEKAKPTDKGGFSEADREVIEQWQQSKSDSKRKQKKHRTLPPGLQKKVDRGGELPPGWKKKLEVGTVLDPEIEKAATPLPEEILKRLPEIPEGTEILQVGDEVIRVIESTREIIGIFDRLSGNAEED